MCSSTECLLLEYWGGDKPPGWTSSPTDHVTWSLILLSSVWEEKSCEWKAVEFWPFPGSISPATLDFIQRPQTPKRLQQPGSASCWMCIFRSCGGRHVYKISIALLAPYRLIQSEMF